MDVLRNLAVNATAHSSDRWLQPLWDLRIGFEDKLASPLFPICLSVGIYFASAFPLTACDLLIGHTKFWRQFRLQADRPITWPMVRRALGYVTFNNVLFILPVSIAQCIWTPPTPMPAKAPTLFEFVWHLSALLVIFDFQYGFWHVVHHKNRWLYKNFHATHHQYFTPFALASQCMHPWELFTNGLFTTVDPWFFNCHPLTTWVWMLANVWLSTEAHSGLEFPISLNKFVPFGLFGGSRKHDMHHMRPLTNFQPYFSTWDRWFGWECPGMKAGGRKPPELVAWEERNKQRRLARHATKLMSGEANGYLSAANYGEDEDKEK